MNVNILNQTCTACPSQWDGWLTDNRMIYCRYRWGILSINISKTPTDDYCDPNTEWESFYSERIGDEYDGIMSQEELITRMKSLGFVFN